MYGRILSRLINTPLAISQEKLDIITSSVTLNLLAGTPVQASAFTPTVQEEVSTEPQIIVISVFDSLVTRNGAGDSGSTSYASIERQINYALEREATHIVFNIGSPGGELEGLFALAERIYQVGQSGVETIAVATGNMCSAAYVLGAACNKVYGTQASIIGSIGVIMTLVDMTAKDKKDGISFTMLRSKDEKALLNPHESISKKAMSDAKAMLTSLDTIMNETVNRYRPNLSIEDIIKTKGNTYLGQEALSLGLIDNITGSFSEVLSSLTVSEAPSSPETTTVNIDLSTNSGANMAATTMTQEEMDALQAKLAAMQTQLDASAGAVEAAKAAEQARFKGIMEAAVTLGIPNANAVAQNMFASGVSLADATSQLTNLKSMLQLANPSPNLNGLDGSLTGNVVETQTQQVTESYADSIANAIYKRGNATAKASFDLSEEANELDAADALLQLVSM